MSGRKRQKQKRRRLSTEEQTTRDLAREYLRGRQWVKCDDCETVVDLDEDDEVWIDVDLDTKQVVKKRCIPCFESEEG